ncbi:MAG: leucine-rich repeat protein, partial [Candidatus Methanomethylophilaceae archaeon]|nr:leucine-rich repeat protein [Candidatus Methanomethylophilaceae archaeon]
MNNYLSALSVAVLSFILLLVPLMVVDAEGTVDVTIHHPDNGHLYLKDCSGSEQTFDGYTIYGIEVGSKIELIFECEGYQVTSWNNPSIIEKSTNIAEITVYSSLDVSVTISAFSIVNGITYYFSDIGNGCARLDAIRAAGSLEISVLDIPGKVSIGNAEYVVTQIGTQFTGSSFSSVDTSKIKIVRIADSVESIGAFAFYNLPNLKSVEFASNSNLKEIGSYAFGMSGHIYSPEEEQGSSQPGEGAAISVDFPADQAVTEQEIPLGEECEVRVSMKCADFGGTPAT